MNNICVYIRVRFYVIYVKGPMLQRPKTALTEVVDSRSMFIARSVSSFPDPVPNVFEAGRQTNLLYMHVLLRSENTIFLIYRKRTQVSFSC